MLYHVTTTSNFWGDDPIVEFDSLEDAARMAMDCGCDIDDVDDRGQTYYRPMTLDECRAMAEEDLLPLPDRFAGRDGTFRLALYNQEGWCVNDPLPEYRDLESALTAVWTAKDLGPEGVTTLLLQWWPEHKPEEIGDLARWQYWADARAWILDVPRDVGEIIV